jgi:hypothetical protein
MKKNNHSVGWHVIKMLAKKVKVHRTINVVLMCVLMFLIVLFCFSGGK